MWTRQQLPTEPSRSTLSPPVIPPPGRTPLRATPRSAVIGASLTVKGHITGREDLQIDGKVNGSISLLEYQLTVGPNAQLNSEIDAGVVIIYGKVVGNVHARNRVDIKRDGSVIGDISTARISIEDGAHFKGRIEIDPAKSLAIS